MKKSKKKIVKYNKICNKLKKHKSNMTNLCKDSIMKNTIYKNKWRRKTNN